MMNPPRTKSFAFLRLIAAPLVAGALLLTAACQGPAAEEPSLAAGEGLDLIIVGTVVTMDGDYTIYDPGYVAIEGGRIQALGPAAEADGLKADRRLDATGKLILPGLINGHQHAPMALFRGVADDLELMEWLRSYIFPAEAKNVDEDFVYWGTLLSAIEMIRSGTTTYADMYYFEDKVAEATAKAGMRGVLGETIIGFPSPDYPDPESALKGTRAYLQKWRDHPLIVPAIAPHAPFTNSTEVLLASKAIADEFDVPLLIHVAETEEEVRQVRQKNGTTPVRYLRDIGFLSSRVVAAHCVWIDEEEIGILAEYDVGVIHNPESNMKLAAGVAPVPGLLAAGVDLGIGTDGPASNNNLDLLQEIDTMAKLHKLYSRDPTVVNARTALTAATRGGAEALGLGDLTGSLEAGKAADLIVLGLEGPPGVPFYDPYSTIVYSLMGSAVETVVIAGQVVFEEGRVTTVDEDEIIARARELRQRILKSLSN